MMCEDQHVHKGVAEMSVTARVGPRAHGSLMAAVLGVGVAAAMIVAALVLSGRSYVVRPLTVTEPALTQQPASGQRALQRLASLAPRGVYVVVDSARNRLGVYSGKLLLREMTCSTGTGVVLRDPRNGRRWIFDTPLGVRSVRDKRRNPVWTKPDWAFIEEGFLPSDNPRYRIDDVSLGDYALDLGDGYLIHGTLFQRLLGRPVTHGCIRLGDEDLEYVYRSVPLGACVFLY